MLKPETMLITSGLSDRLAEQGRREAAWLTAGLVRHEVGEVRQLVDVLVDRWLPRAIELAHMNETGALGQVREAAAELAWSVLDAAKHAHDLERLLVTEVLADGPVSGGGQS